MKVNTLLESFKAVWQLSDVFNRLGNSIEKLSSGRRINSAADEPATFINSVKMQVNIESIKQAVANVVDAISLVQTAAGGVSQLKSILIHMQNLSLQALHNTPIWDFATRDFLQHQMELDLQALDRIVKNTTYGGRPLLDGTFSIKGTAATPSTWRGEPVTFVTAGLMQNVPPEGELKAVILPGYHSVINKLVPVNPMGNLNELAEDETININGIKINLKEGWWPRDIINEINKWTYRTGVRATTNELVFGVIDAYISFHQIHWGVDWPIEVYSDKTGPGTTRINEGVYGSGDYAPAPPPPFIGVSAPHGRDLKGYYVLTVDEKEYIFPAHAEGDLLVADKGEQIIRYNGQEIRVSLEGLTVKMTNYGERDYDGDGEADVNGEVRLTLYKPNTYFQIGPSADERIDIIIPNLTPEALGLRALIDNQDENLLMDPDQDGVYDFALNYTGPRLSPYVNLVVAGGPEHSLNRIKNALEFVLSTEGLLASIQKRILEEAKQNLLIYKENLQLAESNIADTDFAYEAIEVIKTHILSQTDVVLTAQANMLPQVVSNLLREVFGIGTV